MTRPRRIDPGTPLTGDQIRATWVHNAQVRTVEGRVGAVWYSGTQREIHDIEGRMLYEWNVGSAANPTLVELLDAVPAPQESLFDL